MTQSMPPTVPHSVEAEEAVLGSILLNPHSIHDVDFLKPDDFYILRNAWVYESMLSLYETHNRVDVIDNITVAEELRQKGRLNEVGGIAYITYLINTTPAAIYTDVYGKAIQSTAIRRKLIEAAEAIANHAMDESVDIQDTLRLVDTDLAGVTNTYLETKSMLLQDAVKEVSDDIDKKLEDRANQIIAKTVDTGFTDYDQIMGGVVDGSLNILAARPGMGKTACALAMALHNAEEGLPTVFFSLEMGIGELTQRLIAMRSGISVKQLRYAEMTDKEVGLFYQVAGKLIAPLILVDCAGITFLQLKSRIDFMIRKHGIEMVYVDYLQLMDSGARTPNRYEDVGYITRGLKNVARIHNIRVWALAQLNREVEKRADKHPLLSDLRDSGKIEEDADTVTFIYRDEVYNENTEFPNTADLELSKNRHGPTGVCSLYFRKELTLFSNLKKTNVNFAPYEAPKTTWVAETFQAIDK